jgi:endoglucanase
MILYDNPIIPYNLVKAEPLAYNITSLQLLDTIFEESKKQNILILLDIHRLKYGISTPLWYIPNDLNYTYDSIIMAIDYLVDRYKNYPNFFGIDLYNEPHYMAEYGINNYETDWKMFIEHCAMTIFPKYPDYSFLFFINGIDWGKNLTQFGLYPPYLPQEYLNRIVISPHIYGPTLTYVPSYDKNVLYPLWDSLFGYLKYSHQWCICVGEWGGKFNYKKERLWLQIFSDYLIERDFTNNFYWALNPYSMDVTGLMKNWTVFSQEKLDFLQNVQKYPSHFFITDNSVDIL